MNGDQYWRLIWDRANDTTKKPYVINIYANSEDMNLNKIISDHTKSHKQFLIQRDDKMKYKALLKKAQELTKEKVDEITFQESDVSTIIVYNDSSLDYVKKHRHTDSEFTLTVHTTGVAASTSLDVIGEILAALALIFMVFIIITAFVMVGKDFFYGYYNMIISIWSYRLGLSD